MACPITVTKFVGTISLGVLTGLSYSASTITIPALQLLPTSVNASRCLNEVKRLNRKHGLRLANLASGCILFAYTLSPRRRKHPFLVWMCVASTLSSYGVDFWYHRHIGFKAWVKSILPDTRCLSRKSSAKKDEDIVMVEAEENINGETIQLEMDRERRLQRARACLSGAGLAMGIVGLWGDRKV